MKKRNPFPSTGTFSLKGVSFIGALPDWLTGQPSYATPPLQELLRCITTYLERFSPRNQPPEARGHSFTLQGDYGTGKTHALAIALAEAIKPRPGHRPLVLYAKAAEPDFAALFVELTSDLKSDQGLFRLREIGRDALEALLRRQMGGKLREPASGMSPYLEEAPLPAGAEKVASAPAPVSMKGPRGGEPAAEEPEPPTGDLLPFLKDIRVKPAKLWAEQADILNAAAMQHAEFAQAFEYLFAPELGRDARLASVARDWLSGTKISSDDRERLGVSRSIETGEDALFAIQFLATLCGQAGAPLILALDQCEKLFENASDSERVKSRIALNGLLEVVPREGGLLLLAGTAVAWDHLTRELKDRIPEVIRFDRVTPKQATTLLTVYLDAARKTADQADTRPAEEEDREFSGKGTSRLYPFTYGAVRAMLARSGGTMRRLMQLAYDAYSRAPEGTQIGQRQILSLPAKPGQGPADEEAIVRAIEPLLWERGLRFSSDTLDYAKAPMLIVGADGSERALIQITRAVFTLDEAMQAVRMFKTTQSFAPLTVHLPLIVIYAGYASPDVLQEISRSAYVIVYDFETFGADLAKLLDDLRLARLAGKSRAQTAQSEATVDVQKLEQLVETRRAEQQSIGEELYRAGQTEARVRGTERRREARLEWETERSGIEERIRQVRADRAEAESEQLRRHRDASEVDNRRRVTLVFVLATLVCAAAAIGFGIIYSLHGRQERIVVQVATVVAVWVVINSFLFGRLLWADTRLLDELARARGTVIEVERVASRFIARFAWEPRKSSILPQRWGSALYAFMLRKVGVRLPHSLTASELLDDPNPNFRYAAALGISRLAIKPLMDLSCDQLIEFLRGEPTMSVRRALAHAIGLVCGPPNAIDNLARTIPETVYIVEAAAFRGSELSSVRDQRLILVHQFAILQLEDPDSERVIESVMVRLLGEISPVPSLARAYRTGQEPADLSVLEDLPESRLRSAIKILSFEEDGLGTCDHLQVIDRVDELYLLLRQLQFYKNRILLSIAPAPTPPPPS